MKKALVVFARNLELGKVKTRLAQTIGDGEALKVYRDLIAHTCGVVQSLSVKLFLFLPEANPNDNFWARVPFVLREQAVGDLGKKMEAAFIEIFEQGYENIILIGSDCPGLTTEIIEEAFAKLVHTDIVLGPALDGGYYLIGMRQLHKPIFKNKTWSTDVVFAQTIADISKLNLHYETLPVLQDIDVEQDLRIAFSEYYTPQLLFVYNADSDPINQMFDFAHKIFNPSTYACDLCNLTYGNFTMETNWKAYISALSGTQRFLYRNQFIDEFKEEIIAPAIIKVVNGFWYILISADEIANCASLDNLIDLVRVRIPQTSK